MEKIKIGEIYYLKIKACPIQQKNVNFFISTLLVKDLLQICTFKPADYYEVEERFIEMELGEEKINPKELLKQKRKEEFNRHLDTTKIKEIEKYLQNEQDISIFPNNLILATSYKNEKLDIEDKDIIEILNNNASSELIDYFNSISGLYYDKKDSTIYIPLIPNTFLVVDGQHRLVGFTNLYELQNSYQMPVSILIDMDNSVLANIFYTINTKQKPVNKSVLEYMTNLFANELVESKLIHEYIRVLNDNKKSPLYKQIKIFGTGKGLISFAVLHQLLLEMVLPATKRSHKIPIFRDLFVNEDYQYIILNSIVRYFKALKKILSDDEHGNWKKDIIFTKTVGITALIRIQPNIILKILDQKEYLNSSKNIDSIEGNDYYNILKNINHIDTKPYSKTSGLGVATKLKQELIKHLEIEKYNKDFIFNKKIEWITKYYI